MSKHRISSAHLYAQTVNGVGESDVVVGGQN